MPERLLEYNLRARREHKLEVFSCVIYLRAVGDVPQSPLLWTFPKERKALRFDYLVVDLSKLSVEDIQQTGRVGLLPLAVLTRNGATPKVVEEVIVQVEQSQQRTLLPITELLASLVFTKEEDQLWLEERFAMLEDILQETPAYQRILKKGLEQGLEQGREEGREEGREQAREEMLQEVLQAQRAEVVNVMIDRFPALLRFARRQIKTVNDPAILLRLLVKLSTAPDADAARELLLDLSEDEE